MGGNGSLVRGSFCSDASGGFLAGILAELQKLVSKKIYKEELRAHLSFKYVVE
jgi:hypothetical protein